ncbi:MAG: DNA primase [Clostridia bacterium]|nr:DNA primase [Clostridia bacterium]
MADFQELSRFIEELKNRTDIVSVISSYVTVTHRGSSYWARCPFHGEKDASLSIRPNGQYYKCFGCGKGGDVIKFIQEIENCSFMEAVEILAKRANMTMPQSNIDDKALLQKKRSREICASICTQSARHYRGNLVSDKGLSARNYLASRGITMATATEFGLGYSLGYNQLRDHLTANNVSLDDSVMAGVLIRSAKDYYDAMYSRLIIPLIDANGQVVAFGGRILTSVDNVAKYKNTTETPLFSKSKQLFGLNLVKKNRSKLKVDCLIVLEGYMDVISMYQAGYYNCVASMGTALTKEQAKLLKKFTDSVYICYDGDSAGRNATLRGLDILREEQLEVRVVSLPDNLDPDDYIKQRGKQSFDKLIQRALPLIDYKLNILRANYDLDNPNLVERKQARTKYLQNVINVLRPLDEIEREAYCLQLSKETGFDKDFIVRQINNKGADISSMPVNNSTNVINTERTLNKITRALAYIATCLLYAKPFAKIDSKPDCIDSALLSAVFDYILRCKQSNTKLNPSMVLTLNTTGEDEIAQLIIDEDSFVNQLVDQVRYLDCVSVIQQAEVVAQIEVLKSRLQSATSQEQREILDQIKKYTLQLKELQMKREE